MHRERRQWAAFAFFCAVSLFAFTAAAAPPPPNTVISNTALATYTEAGGRLVAKKSNTVEFTVRWVSAFVLSASQTRVAPPGASVAFPHTLVNTGNGPDTFDLAVTNNSGGSFNFSAVSLHADANGDGAPDNLTPIASTGVLASGAAFKFVALAVVPAAAGVARTDTLTVTANGNAAAAAANSYTAAAAATNVDTVTTTGNAVMVVNKTLEVTQGPSPNTNGGAHIRVRLHYRNIGAGTATNFRLTDSIGVAGAGTEGFAYQSGFARWNETQALSDAAGGDPAGIAYDFGATAANAVTAAVASVPPGTSGSISFAVDVKANLQPGVGATSNQASFTYHDGAANVGPFVTNTAAYNVLRARVEVWKTISVPYGVSPTSFVVFTINYRNSGNATATNVTLADAVGVANTANAGFTYLAGSGAWNATEKSPTQALTDAAAGDPAGINYAFNAATSTVSATIGSLAAGASGSVSFRADVKPSLVAGTVLVNRAYYCYGDGPNVVPSAACNLGVGASALVAGTATNETRFTVVGASAMAPDLRIAKTANGAFTANNCGAYTINVTNDGAQPTSGLITVQDTLPAGLVYQPSCRVGAAMATSGGGGWTCPASASGGTIVCTSNEVVPAKTGATAGRHPSTLTIVARADTAAGLPPLPPAPGTIVVNNTATVSGGGEPAANTGNNSAVAATTIGPSATIRGTVWRDVNHDRIFLAGNSAVDEPMPGWRVEALQGGVVLASAVTGDDGQYAIGNLIPGGYQIRFRDPSNNIVNGRPVCNEYGADSSVSANCEAASLSGNKAVRNTGGETIDVTLTPGDTILRQSLPLDPSGVVYDSVTRRPIAGATVELLVPAGFNPSLHLIGGSANVTQVTGATGFYQYVLTSQGVTFCTTQSGGGCLLELRVTPPGGYLPPPSTLLPAALSSGGCAAANCLDPTGLGGALNVFSVQPQNLPNAPPDGAGTTYYFRFFLTAGDPDVVNNHIPLDPLSVLGNALLVQKTANRLVAEIGDFVDYTVRVRNGGANAAASVSVNDRLPFGFVYVSGSGRVAGVRIADPAGGGGPSLAFAIGGIASRGTAELTYRARLGNGAAQGDGTNRAAAAAPGFGSNSAQVRVRVIGGVFSDKGYLAGKVYADCNGDGVQNRGEPGVPGVRLYLQDGTWVVTDGEGKYSLYGLAPRTHTLKVDRTTLPEGARLRSIANRQAGDAGSRFVDLKKGELHRGDFAIDGCEPEVMRQIEARRAKGDVFQAETVPGLERQFPIDGKPQPPGDPRGLPSSGVVGAPGAGTRDVFRSILEADRGPANSNLPPSAAARGPQPLALAPPSLEAQVEKTDNRFAILNLKDREVLPIAQTYVQVKGVLGATFKLTVNGVEVPASRVGKKSVLESKQIEAWEYVGVQLQPGENRIEFTQLDAFGNVRGSTSVTVLAPGDLAKLVLEAPATATADSSVPVRIKLRVLDANGVPVTARTAVTLESDRARWREEDLDPREPGTQIFVEKGEAEVALVPPQEPGEAKIKATGSNVTAEAAIVFLPNLRPLIAAGAVEGTVALRSFSVKKVLPARERDGFEQEIRKFAQESSDGRRSAAGRGALFLKGKVKGDYLLTLAYDSDKDLRERVFRDISPDEFYPVYGDSSVRGFDAQTTGRFYLRLDKDRSYVLFGDYNTAATAPARALTQFNRSLTGLRHHYETGRIAINTFASQDTFRQIVEEIPANGTSGPYQLANGTQIVNSEKVEILTRDRSQPGLILKTEPQARFSDYEIEPFTGRILFKAPVPSLDANLNPRSIRVTYEIDQGGERFWIAGVDAQVKLTDNLEVGAVAIRDANPGNEFSLGGVNTTVKLGEKTTVTAELAHTDRRGLPLPGVVVGRGEAARVELKHQDQRWDARIFAGSADTGFSNPASTLSRGRAEAGGKATYKLNKETTLGIEAVHSEDKTSGGSRDGLLLKMERSLPGDMKLEVGARRVSETAAPAFATSVGATPNDYTSVLGKLTVPVPGVAAASVYGEYEQDIESADRRVVAAGGEYRTARGARLYGRHEFISSLQGRFGLNPAQRNHTTVFGIDTPYMNEGKLFSEYRLRDAIDGRQAEAALGLRNQFRITDTMKLGTTFERVHPLSGATGPLPSSESTALTGALEWTHGANWKGSSRAEWRDSATSVSRLYSAGYAVKLNREWTGLARTLFNVAKNKAPAAGKVDRSRFQAGLAYRDVDTNALSAFARVEHRKEEDSTQPLALKRALYLGSYHFNYEPHKLWLLSGGWAAKYVIEDSLNLRSSSTGHLFSGRVTYDIHRDWDIGVTAAAMTQNGLANRKYGLGLEVGYLLSQNLWLSIGYNFFGFRERDLASENHTDKGWFIRLRYKFDEDLFAPPGGGKQRAPHIAVADESGSDSAFSRRSGKSGPDPTQP